MNNLYQTSVQLYASSLRALEQRAASFLLLQSILVGAFAILLRYFQTANDVHSFFPTLGIASVGLATSIVFFKAHQITARDVSYWKAYMRLLETKEAPCDTPLWQQPWRLMHEYGRRQGKGFFSYSYALERLPGPLLWLAFPVIFVTVWSIALLWVINFLEYLQFIAIGWFWIVPLGSSAIAGGVIWYKWTKPKDDTYERLTRIAEKGETEATNSS